MYEILNLAEKDGVRERLEAQIKAGMRSQTSGDAVADLGRGLPEIKLTRAPRVFGDDV